MQVTDYPNQVIHPVWSPDGTRAIAATIFPGSKVLMFDPRVPAGQQRVEELPPFAEGFAPPRGRRRDARRRAWQQPA